MTNILCNVTTPEFSNRHDNVKRVRIELRSGIVEIYPDHQDLLGTIALGEVQVEEIIDDKSVISTYIAQDGLVTVDNSKNQNTEKTVIDIISTQSLQITKELTYEYCNQKYEESKQELDKIFELIKDSENLEEFELTMRSEFSDLQKEIAYWDKIRLIVKDRDKRN